MSNLAQTTVLGLLVYELTGSELALGFLGLAEFAPAALLVVVAGSVVDRFDRRWVASLGALSNALVALAMAWYVRHPHGLSTTPIFLLVVAFGAGQAFLAPALRSIPPAMVPNAGVPWLVARRSIASEAATILGPILGGLLYVVGVWVALVAVAALSFIGAAAILAIRVTDEERLRTTDISPAGDDEVSHVLEEGIPASRGGLHEAMEGLRFVRATPILLGAISLDLFAVLFGGAVTLLPAIAVGLHVGPVGLGWLRASVGMGAGAATLLISVRPIPRLAVFWTSADGQLLPGPLEPVAHETVPQELCCIQGKVFSALASALPLP
jgi:MFS family permease